MDLKVKKLREDAVLPMYAYEGDAGLDLFSLEDYVLKPGERKLFKTGLSMEIPPGFVGLIWDKSGVASNHGVKTMAGVIDSTYRGEIGILLFNTSAEPFNIGGHEKIAQMLIQKVESVNIVEASGLPENKRGSGSFGSTGKK